MRLDTFHVVLIILVILLAFRLCYLMSADNARPQYQIENLTQLETSTPSPSGDLTPPYSDRVRARVTELWIQGIIYTRLMIMAYFARDPQYEYLRARLARVKQSFANAIANVHGEQVGKMVLQYLMLDGQLLLPILETIEKQNQAAFEFAVRDFYQNARNLGAYLDHIYKSDKIETQMLLHIEYLVNNILAYANNDYNQDIQTLDNYIETAVTMITELAETNISNS